MPFDVTLQINLSGGDVAYAALTVPALVAAHRSAVREVLGVVDCVRPQRTQMVDPDERFPLDTFAQRRDQIDRQPRRRHAVGHRHQHEAARRMGHDFMANDPVHPPDDEAQQVQHRLGAFARQDLE